MFNPKLKAASLRLEATFEALNKAVVGRAAIIRQLKYAVITGQHLLLEGPPGVAKSYMVLQFFKALRGCRTFKVQCTKKMTEDYIVGPLDMRRFREEGLYVHRVENMLPDAHFGFIDEIMDLNSGALRAMLEILNERTFTRGIQQVKSPLHTAVATTNFNRDQEEELAAVLDRFLFRAKVQPLTRVDEKRKMIHGVEVDIPPLDWRDVRYLNRMMKTVTVSTELVDTYLKICDGLKITDRTIKRCVDIIRANAVLAGRTKAVLEDLSVLDVCFVTTNDRATEQQYAQAAQAYAQAYADRKKAAALVIICNRVSFLERAASAAESYEDMLPIATEAREAYNAIQHFSCAARQRIAGPSAQTCEEIMSRADAMYAEENA